MGYTCLKPMKIQVAPGKVETRMPGQPVPEAEMWPNPAAWIRRGFIAPDDDKTASASGYSRERLVPARPATVEDKARAVSAVPQPGKPLPSAPTGLLDDAGGDAGLPEDGDTKSELMRMSRADMEAFARDNTGIADPSSYPNKESLANAILESAGE